MLIRLITVISLFKFMLLMISGSSLEVALYRSILVFVILYTVFYMTIFFLNVIRENPENKGPAVPETSNSQSKKQD